MSKNTQLASLINYISVDGSGNVILSSGQIIATQNYVATAVSNLVASAPSTLDTLNELATALGNDANFATTVTNSIATKLPLSGGTLTGALSGTTITTSGSATFGSDVFTYANGGIFFNGGGSYTSGIFQQSGGSLALQTNGTPRVKIDSNGSVGFVFRNVSNEVMDLLVSTETANPSKSKISLMWYGNETASIKFKRGGDATGGSLEFWTQAETQALSQRMTITGGGSVGIRSANPEQPLHVNQGISGFNQGIPGNSGTTQNGILRLTPAQNTFGECLDFGMNVATTYAWIQATNYGNLGVNYNLALNPNGGNVAIGTSSPSTALHVISSDVSGNRTSPFNVQTITATSGNAPYDGFGAGLVFAATHYNGVVYNGARIRNVLNDNSLTSVGNSIAFDITPTRGGALTQAMIINYNGELLVGTNVSTSSDPVHRIGTNGGTTYARLMIQERMGVWISLNTGGTNYGTINLSGGVVVYGGQSDYRLKENIRPMNSGLDKIMNLKPVTFKWKRDGSYGEGFIAHELQEVVPIAVTGVKDGLNEVGEPAWQNVDKSHIVPIIVKGMQELKAENDELREILKRNNII